MSTAQANIEADATERNSITWLNMSGDITITWDETNKEKMLEMIRKKMADGYNFFTTKRVPIIGVERKVRVSNKNIDSISSIVIPDNEFEKLMAGVDDKDVAMSVRDGVATMAKRKAGMRALDMVKRLDKAEDIVKNQSLAFRTLTGG